MAENRVIGRGGQMPWYLPADLGKPIIMGRLTYASLGRVLDGRHNIVLSRQLHLDAPGFQATELTVAHSLSGAFDAAREAASSHVKEIMIIGGASVYEQALPFASRLHLTQVHATIEGDVRFPQINLGEWREISRMRHKADDRNPYEMSFIEYERRNVGRHQRSAPTQEHHGTDYSQEAGAQMKWA